jgi:predicted phosphodiesterase
MKNEKPAAHPKVGIMADSHGQAETIVAAIAFLSAMACSPIYHLGDICDSLHPETAEACVRPLWESNVKAIKGNNDHAIVANQVGLKQATVPKKTLSFLRNLPLTMHYENAIFTHSLPFDRELGLASMIGAMGKNEANLFFEASPRGLLFRGHSHTPEIIRREGPSTLLQTLSAGEKVVLRGRLPSVVTCGALTRGLCMVWRPVENMIECLAFY